VPPTSRPQDGPWPRRGRGPEPRRAGVRKPSRRPYRESSPRLRTDSRRRAPVRPTDPYLFRAPPAPSPAALVLPGDDLGPAALRYAPAVAKIGIGRRSSSRLLTLSHDASRKWISILPLTVITSKTVRRRLPGSGRTSAAWWIDVFSSAAWRPVDTACTKRVAAAKTAPTTRIIWAS